MYARAAANTLRQQASHRTLVLARRLTTSSSTSSQPSIRTAVYATLFAASAGLFAVYYYDARSAIHRYVLTPALRHTFDAETGHKIAVKVLRSGLGPRDPVRDDETLRYEVGNYLTQWRARVATKLPC
jgi:dihydroorotate dehydrogenase